MSMSRREALKGVTLGTGAFVLSPILQQLRAEAAGAAPRKRFVFVVEGNGLPWNQIQPVGIARNGRLISSGGYTSRSGGDVRSGTTSIPLANHDLPDSLQPVAEFKNRLTIVQGLSGKMNGGGHSNDFGALGAYNARGGVGNSGTPQGETIDYALGRRLGGVFPQIGLGISDRADHSMIYNCSAAGRDRALPTQCRPDLAYMAMFGSIAGGEGQRAFSTRRNVLDFMVDDIRRLESSLAGPEREKLQAYLRAFEDMRQRHGQLVELEATLRRNAPPVTNKFTSDIETDRLDAQFDLAGAALVSGLTNVVTIASGAGNPYFSVRFDGLGIRVGKHTIGHGGGFEGRTAEQLATTIRRFHFDLIARLARRLQQTPEGNGTMFDNTCIVYLSDAAEGHHSRCWEWPMVLLGNLGGRLRAGQYLELPGHGAANHRHIGNMYTTLLNAAGFNVESFGQPDPLLGRDVDQRGPVAELLA